jgi:hypothetical protein
LVIGFKFKSSPLNQGYFKIQGEDLNFRIMKIYSNVIGLNLLY